MQSRISCFNPTLFRKNLTRFWPIWGMASFIGVLCPLILFMQIQRGYSVKPLEMTEMYYNVAAYALPVVSLFYAVLCALAVWSYLYTSRSVGLMHALPIRRQGLFVTNFLSGMTMLLIPYAVTGILTVLMSLLFGFFEPVGVLVATGAVMAESFFYFSSATAVAFVTGNMFAMPALYFIFHFLAVIMDFMVSTFANGFLFGLEREYNGVVEFLSPTVYLMKQMRVDTEYTQIANPDGSYYRSEITSVTMENGHLVAIYAAVGLALLVLAWRLYRRRRSESAGDVVAVGWMKPVFRWGVTVCGALLGGQALYLLLLADGTYTVIPMVICMVVAGGIGYYAASMLLAKSLRVFRGSWKGLVALAVLSAALCVGLEADAFGVERRVPDASAIEVLEMRTADNTYRLVPGEDDLLMDRARALHGAVAADADYITDFRYSGEAEYNNISFTYTLKGGVEMSRRYWIPLTRERMAREGTYDFLLNDFVNCEAAKAKRLHLGDSRYTVESANIWGLENDTYDFNSREAGELLAAVGRDMQNGNWGEYDFFESDDAGCLEACLEFSFYYDSSWNGRHYDYISVNLRPEMKETLGLLERMGLLVKEDLRPLGEKYPERYRDEAFYREYETVYGNEASVGIIGGADGATEVFVAGVTA